ncbi:L-aspartate 1-decarboxylase [Salsuginibacillus halophilus]|uniref:Aspartate 1-decarboxylase n=1 Tax=Salsuginibacillus halophilus TaxID=517424 RepID=A0A2P8HLB9_9BACI|nr:aspartate 1-decarboxylase [Salsuginibacillus halophilus]PSL47006.1 L-aspartate 1-decarboxylase [Salsuginibacillus halophilus]
MYVTMMKSKIHCAKVTEANLNYVGSITIDTDILDKVDLLPNEMVQVVNNTNGERLETYVIAGERGGRDFCLNGAAARRCQVGDEIIIIAYGQMERGEASEHEPKVIYMFDHNTNYEMLSGTENEPFRTKEEMTRLS